MNCKRRKQIKHIALVGVIALIILLLTQASTNLRVLLGTEKTVLTWFEFIRSSWNFNTDNHQLYSDSLLLIDVHNDRQMMPVGDSDIMEPVVNHDHLYRLLHELNEHGNYRYIMLDVFLDDEICQPRDSALYNQIANMPRIVIPRRRNSQPNNIISSKAGLAQYNTALWESDFVKYPYIIDDKKSMPLLMYEEITGRHIRSWGGMLIDGGPVRKSAILTYDIKEDKRLMKNLYYLDMMVDTDDSMLSTDDVRGKYVLIGDFKADRHNTFIGEMSGTIINFNAYVSLLHGLHQIFTPMLIYLYIFIYILVWITLHRTPLTRAMIWIGYTILLTAFCLWSYCKYQQVYDLLWTALLFFLLEKLTDCWIDRHQIRKSIANLCLALREWIKKIKQQFKTLILCIKKG